MIFEILSGEGNQLLLACAATFLAGLIRGFAGFGSGMIMVAVLLSLYPPLIAMPTVLFTELVLSAVMLPGTWRHAHWRLIQPMVIAAAMVAPLGVWILGLLSDDMARLLASIMILCFVSMAVLRKSVKRTATRVDAIRAGGLSGLLGGFAGMTGPPVVAMLLRTALPPRDVRASLVGYFVIVDGLLLANFSFQTDAGFEFFKLGLVVLIPLVAGSLIGAWLFPKASPRTYRNLALAAISAAAVVSPVI